MKSKLVLVVALVGFSASTFANTARVIETAKVGEKNKELAAKAKATGKTSELDITTLLASELGFKSNPQMVEQGLTAYYKADVVKKMEFRARLMAAHEKPETRQFAEVAMQLLGKLGGYAENSRFAEQLKAEAKGEKLEDYTKVIETLMKNIELTEMDVAAPKLMDQAEAINNLLYVKFSLNKTKVTEAQRKIISEINAEYIDMVGVLNIKKSDPSLKLSAELQKKVFRDLEDLTTEQKAELKKLKDAYEKACV